MQIFFSRSSLLSTSALHLPSLLFSVVTLISLEACQESSTELRSATSVTGLGPSSSDPLSNPLSNSQSRRASKADQWEAESGNLEEEAVQVARIALADLRGEPIEPESISGYFRALPIGFNGSKEGSLREGIKGTLGAQRLVARGQAGVLREDRWVAQTELKPKLWINAGGIAPLIPSTLEADAEVTFARLFESEEEAIAAPALTPLDLPFNTARALALEEGTVAQVPLLARVSFQLSGHQLTGSWSRFDQLHQWLKSSAVGFASAAPQGSAILEGRYLLTITRHDQSWVRVCLQRSHQSTLSTSAQLNAGISERLTFYPSALVDRARSVKDRLLKWGKRPHEHLSAWANRLEMLKRRLPAVLTPLLERARRDDYPAPITSLLERAEENLDPALALLNRGQEGAELASAWIEERVEATLGRVDRHLNPLFDRVKRYSERAFHLNASITLSAEQRDQVGVLGDYLIDLSTEEGALAYTLMVSGGARWSGLDRLNPDDTELTPERSVLNTLDLTVVDSLASSGVSGIRRLRSAQLKGRARQIRLNASGPLTSWRHESGHQRYQLTRVEDQVEERWNAELWRVDRGWRAAYLNSSEVLQSGQLSREPSRSGEESWVYWLSWRRHWPQSASAPVGEAFAEALNLTGSIGVAQGLPQLFYAEAPGALDAQLTVIYSEKLLNALVHDASADLLWSAAATTAAQFDNTFGLPFMSSFGTPGLSPTASLACDTVAYHWGRGYCRVIDEDLIQPLLALRSAPISDSERRAEQRRWLADLSQRGVFLNPIGGRVISRWLIEVADQLSLGDEVSIQFKLEHPTAPEASLTMGSQEDLLRAHPENRAALEVAQWLGIGEGLQF